MAAQERCEYQPKGLGDIWYEPTNKEVSGWRGPAQVATVNRDEGNVTVRFQGRTLDRKTSDVRVRIPYLVYATGLFNDQCLAFHFLVCGGRELDEGQH